MSIPVHAASLQERLQALEQENARLKAELEQARRLHEDLRRSEDTFRGAIENASIGVALITPEGSFVDCNQAYCELTGYSMDELRGMRFSSLVHPDDRAANRTLNERLRAGEVPSFVVRNRYVRKGGQMIWVRERILRVLDEVGQPKWLLALVEDFTEQIQAEQERLKSERIYRAIGESIPYGIWVCDPDGNLTYASQSLLDMLGVTMEEYQDFRWMTTLEPEEAEYIAASWREFIKTGGFWDMEHHFRGADGQIHPVLGRGVPVRDDDGKLIAWAGINLDISDLKQTQTDLLVSRQRFESVLRNSPIAFSTQDRDLRYTWVYNALLGIEVQQLIGKREQDVRDPQEVAELVGWKRSVLETGVGQRHEFSMRDAGGTLRTFDMTIEPLRDASGAIIGITSAGLDITERTRRERELRENQLRIELRRRLLDQREEERLSLARDVHDGPVQTLASLNMELDMARRGAQDPEVRRELGRIRQHLQHAMEELRGLVGELRTSLLQGVGLTRAMRLHAHDYLHQHPGLDVTWHLEPVRGRLGMYGELALFRIYQEALSNVVKHAQATKASVRLSFTDGSAVLEVRDNGKGMDGSPDLMEQTARGHYGLAGMQERAEAVNGELKCVSEPGKGATVIVRIPVEE